VLWLWYTAVRGHSLLKVALPGELNLTPLSRGLEDMIFEIFGKELGQALFAAHLVRDGRRTTWTLDKGHATSFLQLWPIVGIWNRRSSSRFSLARSFRGRHCISRGRPPETAIRWKSCSNTHSALPDSHKCLLVAKRPDSLVGAVPKGHPDLTGRFNNVGNKFSHRDRTSTVFGHMTPADHPRFIVPIPELGQITLSSIAYRPSCLR
jgi:hypothetical protein